MKFKNIMIALMDFYGRLTRTCIWYAINERSRFPQIIVEMQISNFKIKKIWHTLTFNTREFWWH